MLWFKNIKLTAFGKFRDFSLDFKPTFNLVLGKNESGKSTLFHALLGILFGFKNKKELYLPYLKEGSYLGSISLENEKEEIIIERNFNEDKVAYFERDKEGIRQNSFFGKIAPLGRSSEKEIYFEKIEKIFGSAQEDLLASSIFISQNKIASPLSEESKQRIKNLISGFNETNYDQLIENFREKYFSLTKINPAGLDKRNDRLLEELQQQIIQLKERITVAQKNFSAIKALEEETRKLEAEIKEKEEKVSQLEKRTFLLLQSENLFREEKDSRKNFARLSQEKEKIKTLKTRLAEIDQLRKKVSPFKILYFLPLVPLISLLFLKNILIFLSFLFLGLVTAVFFFSLQRRKRKSLTTQRFKLLSQLEILADEKLIEEEYYNLTKELVIVDQKLKTIKENLGEGENLIITKRELDLLKKELSGQKINFLEKKQRLNLAASQTENPLPLEEELEELKEKEKRVSLKAQALLTGASILEQSLIKFREMHLHHLSQEIVRYFNKIRQGLTTHLILKEDFSLALDWEKTPFNIENLSLGTLDQLYFAIRFALLNLLSQEEKLPFIMDDPFVNFDLERRREALDFLKILSQEHQIIFFSHERGYLEHLKDINVIELGG